MTGLKNRIRFYLCSKERARQLRREIDVWQQQNTVYCASTEELETLHSTSQRRYHKFLSGISTRRMADHRSKLITAQIKTNIQILEGAPGM